MKYGSPTSMIDTIIPNLAFYLSLLDGNMTLTYLPYFKKKTPKYVKILQIGEFSFKIKKENQGICIIVIK